MHQHIFIILILVLGSASGIAQNVGIGTNSPQVRLHVKDTVALLPTELLIDSEGSAIMSLNGPLSASKLLQFQAAGSAHTSMGLYNGVFKIYSDTTAAIAGPTMILSPHGNVGINMSLFGSPGYPLDVVGKMRISDDGTSPAAGVMRYNSTDDIFEGHDGASWNRLGSHWSTYFDNMYYNDGPVLVGRTNTIGSERFGVRIPVISAAYGGMYMETNGHMESKPFYGYAINNLAKMWHYFDGADQTWKMFIGGANRLAISNTGNMGVGTMTPGARIDIAGTSNGVLSGTEGDLRIGNTDYRLKFGMTTTGADAGLARIYSAGGVNRLVLGAGTTDVLTVENTGDVGVGTSTPAYPLDVKSTIRSRGVNVLNEYSGVATKYGGYFDVTATGSNAKYGVYSRANGTPSSAGQVYGLRAYGNGNSNTGSVYGVYAQVASGGTGNHYALYANASTANPGTFTKSWAVYAVGHSYFANDVRIGTLNGADGFRLAVDGKIISEELKIQMSTDWPDYVFDKSYSLLPLAEVRRHIRESGHLPGVPSAREISDNGGFEVGEMHKVLLEKVEELTLYILQQDEQIRELQETVNQLKQ